MNGEVDQDVIVGSAVLQNLKVACNGAFDGCEPYYFNHALESNPVTLFYDGHVDGLPVAQAMADDAALARRFASRQAGRQVASGRIGSEKRTKP